MHKLILTETLASVLFYVTWIKIRKHSFNIHPDFAGISNLIKPMMISISFYACAMLFNNVTKNVLNPTLVFEIWIYNLALYNNMQYDPKSQQDNKNVSVYTAYKFNTYIWIYLMSSLIAAPIAGYLANSLLSDEEKDDPKKHKNNQIASQNQQNVPRNNA